MSRGKDDEPFFREIVPVWWVVFFVCQLPSSAWHCRWVAGCSCSFVVFLVCFVSLLRGIYFLLSSPVSTVVQICLDNSAAGDPPMINIVFAVSAAPSPGYHLTSH